MTSNSLIGISLDGRYRIIQELGGGSFGKTYVAEDIKLIKKPLCLVKQLKPTKNDPSTLTLARRLFELEAKKLEELGDHPQIPRIMAYFEDNEEFYLVQEFIEGHTLSKEIIPQKKLSESYVVALLQSVLEPLSYLHENQVIHRDIKPDNLMRRKNDGKIFLIDFGAVKEVSVTEVDEHGITKKTIVIGTKGYMPSEQFNGRPKLSSDIFAVGMTAIYALTGIQPKKLPLIPQTLEVQWPYPPSANPMLVDFLSRMILYDHRRRPLNATEALKEIKEIAPIINKWRYTPPVEPSLPPTLVALPNANQLIDHLTLAWVDHQGNQHTQVISPDLATKNQGTFRIGRDPQKCDLIFAEAITVSREHIEIFFHAQEQRFYLRSLRQNNPPEVDGEKMLSTEIPLQQGNIIKLGDLVLEVACVEKSPPNSSPVIPPPPVSPQTPATTRNVSQSISEVEQSQPNKFRLKFW